MTNLRIFSLFKKMIFLAASFLTFSTFVGSRVLALETSSIEDQIKKAQPYKFLHCQAKDSTSRAATPSDLTHYVLDIRSAKTKLYTAQVAVDGQNLPMRQRLVNLKMIDAQMSSDLVMAGFDVVYFSSAVNLTFKLVIKDNDGQLLEGLVSRAGQQADQQVICKDVVLK